MGGGLTAYLMAVYHLTRGCGTARVCDVARNLGVAGASAIQALRRLESMGLVNYGRRGTVSLTPKGVMECEALEERTRVLARFLREVLGVPAPVAERDARAVAHLVHPLTLERMRRLLENRHRFLPARTNRGWEGRGAAWTYRRSGC